jgi:hypothetical protein
MLQKRDSSTIFPESPPQPTNQPTNQPTHPSTGAISLILKKKQKQTSETPLLNELKFLGVFEN